jgi:hypothetical protein
MRKADTWEQKSSFLGSPAALTAGNIAPVSHGTPVRPKTCVTEAYLTLSSFELVVSKESDTVSKRITIPLPTVCHQVSEIDLVMRQEEKPNDEILRSLDRAGQFDFWKAPEEDIYTLDDGEELS